MSLQKLIGKFQLRIGSVQTFFGIGKKQLDTTMRYRNFGAVWQIKNGYRYILGYWFCDNENDSIKNINGGQWANLINQGEFTDFLRSDVLLQSYDAVMKR